MSIRRAALAGAALNIDDIRPCLEGAIPGVMATCAADGTPNVTYISQVEYVDALRLAWRCRSSSSTRRAATCRPTRGSNCW